MLPGLGRLSSVPVEAEFLAPRDRPYENLVSYEFGGPDLNTPAQSRTVKIWVAYYDVDTIKVGPEDGSLPPVAVYTDPNITQLSLAFDQNMRATLCFVSGGVLKLRWFDTIANAMVVTSFPGADRGQVTCDDKRDTEASVSDIIFVYTQDNALYYRQQRDRYSVEYLLAPFVKGKVLRIGMSVKNRLQIEVGERET